MADKYLPLPKSGRGYKPKDFILPPILAEKKEAEMTYKGFRGYMPIVGHLAENGLVVYDEFRQGNTTPSARNLEFIKDCERQIPKGKRIEYLRADAASYQAEIFNYCEEQYIVWKRQIRHLG